MTETRTESDTLGPVAVPKTALWGAQTERSRHNFPVGPLMPVQVIRALIEIKRAAARVNAKAQKISSDKATALETASDYLLALPDQELMQSFPLHVYQTGSGTQTNMNVNEVLTHVVADQQAELRVQPNDDVNASQSSNDTFPTAMNMAAYQAVQALLPQLEHLMASLKRLETKYWQVVKIGRTHLQDATPLTFGQEISGWLSTVQRDTEALRQAAQGLLQLPIGGTAVGTGLNTPPHFDTEMVAELSAARNVPYQVTNKFAGLTAHSDLLTTHGVVRTLASDLLKIANDIRFLASGPRAGYGELTIPANEPGSSIMPGKVNPTQAEAMTMAATRIMGNDTTLTVANSQGNFEMNVYKPVMIASFLESVDLLTGLLPNFTDKMVAGIQVNQARMEQLVDDSLMTVTALAPHIGYHQAAEIANQALAKHERLRDAALDSGLVTAAQFDQWVQPLQMTNYERN
ncbi:class II fumarate hydratase [Fructilactobacillus myrtifloralis]|uniref:Fumarate hydratase class II n=1 Tax=Fructilactobacillus myrtifloralis TaxID=2940301 RepID=A0ABY5BNU3_9LACO|nr:class II fumarate hydratase [Fructilactobacillus myrtifloralis]USS84772.1 class II fumarate hydratase [Fructilactobacillus myrtifloralis]